MAIYFDLCFYETILKSFHYDLEQNINGTLALKNMYKFILKNYFDGIIGPKKMAYDIAATGFYKIARTEPFSEITSEAADLELPNQHVSGNPVKRFDRLVEKISEIIA